MLSALQQGSLVHIIDKTKEIKYLTGEVVDKTEPINDYGNPISGLNTPTFFNLTLKVNNETYELKHINSSLSVANNGNIIVSETKEALTPVVEGFLYSSKKIIDPENIEFHTNCVESCEDILKKLNPTFAKEKERDVRIKNLEDNVGNINDKLDKIFNFISNTKQV